MKPSLRDHLDGHMIVWIARLSQTKDNLPALEDWLDDRDRERAARFHFPEDRGRFVLGRALVRKGLGHYLEREPGAIELAYTDLGRPIYPHDDQIHFSITHTQDLVALALTRGARIGIDIESIKDHSDLLELAERILSPADLGKFQAMPEPEKLTTFYRVWTRKEAYLKARGEGIAEGLRQISVSLGPEETPSIEDNRTNAAENWRLLTLPVPAEYAGTLACDGTEKHLEGAFVRLSRDELVTDSTF